MELGRVDTADSVHRRHVELVEELERATDAANVVGRRQGCSNAGIYLANGIYLAKK